MAIAVESKKSLDTKAYHFTNVEEVIAVTNGDLEDILYIGDKNKGRSYRADFTLKTKAEAQQLIKDKQAVISHKDKESEFFVYNERTGELAPFKKNDYLIYEHGYLAFDGTDYFSYDDNGTEVGKFPFAAN